MSSAVDANNETTFYDYDALSRKSKTRSPDGSFTAQYFLDYGSAIQRYRTHVSDDSTGRWAGFRWTEDYFDGLGRTYETRSEGATPIDADILFKQYMFVDASDRISSESSVFKSAETPVWTIYSYDGLKRHIDTLLPGGRFHTYSTYLQGSEQKFDERGHMREFFHDAAGRIVKVRERHQIFENNPEGGSGAYDYYDTQYEYDANDWMTKITDSLGRTSTTDYNSLGWKLESRDWDLGISRYTYNSNGSLASEIDARNFSKEYTYDSIGRNTFTKHKDNTGSITRAITQSYDRDPATGLTQGSSLGRLVKISDTTVNYKGCYRSPSAHYTRIGAATADTIESCVARVLAGGYDFAALEFGGYCYGGFALIAPVAESECNTPCTGNSAEVCGGLGRGSVYGTWGSNTIVDASWYDKMGRPDQQQRCIDRGLGAARSCSSMMSTFEFGRLKTLTYPDGETLTSNYNGAGQLSSMSDYLTNALYNSQGQPTEETYANSTTTVRTYYPDRFWPESMAVQTLYKASYTYDGAGRMLTRTQIAPTEDTTYNYDDLNRLMTVASVSTPLLNQTFDYDRVGNMTYNSKVGFYGYYLPAHIHAVSSIFEPVFGGTYSYSYDANGNNISSIINQLTWNNDNRMTQNYNTVTRQTANYTYDVMGRRVSKTVGAKTTNYFSRYVETDASGTTKYYYAGHKLVAKRDPSGTSWYYHQDHLGSTRVVTEQGGASHTPSHTYRYPAFGATTPGERFGFAGAESDDETGLLYMEARHESPTLGRMLSADTLIPDVFNPQSLNRYSYVLNNPTMYSDPSGHQPQPEGPVSDPSEWARWPYPRVNETLVRGHRSDPPLVEADVRPTGPFSVDRLAGGFSVEPIYTGRGIQSLPSGDVRDESGKVIARREANRGASGEATYAMSPFDIASAARGAFGAARVGVGVVRSAAIRLAGRATTSAVESVVSASAGSIRQAVTGINQAGLGQSQAVQAIIRVTEVSGRQVGGVVDLAGGAKGVIGVVQGASQPIVHIAANGTATFGRATVSFGDAGGKVITTVTNVVLQ